MEKKLLKKLHKLKNGTITSEVFAEIQSVRIELANFYFENKMFKETLFILEETITDITGSHLTILKDVLHLKCVALEEIGNYELAIKLAKQLLIDYPYDDTLYLRLKKLYETVHEDTEYFKEKTLGRDVTSYDTKQYQLAVASFREKNFALAIERFKDVLDYNVYHKESILGVIDSYCHINDAERAIQWCYRYLEIDPSCINIYERLQALHQFKYILS